MPDCYVWVSYPNVFYGYHVGETMIIRWFTHTPAAQVSIDLYKDGVFVCNIVPATENDGDFDWFISGCEISDGKHQVKVTDTADSTCSGFSEPFWLGL